MQEYLFNFSAQQLLTGTADQNSTNVHDAGSAKKLFTGVDNKLKGRIEVTAAGGTSPTYRGRMVSADDAALTSNVLDLYDTGVTPVLAAADLPYAFEFEVNLQKTAKRYYGFIHKQSGTNPTATVNASLAMGPQSAMVK